MLGLIIASTIGGLMIILGIVFLTGRGAFLIAGFNTKPNEKQAKYDVPSLCRFIGKVILPMAVLVIAAGIEPLRLISWFWIAWIVVFIWILSFMLIYANTGGRFKK